MCMCVFIQRLVVTVVDGSQREWSMKDSVLMLSVVATLAEQLDQVSSEVWHLSQAGDFLQDRRSQIIWGLVTMEKGKTFYRHVGPFVYVCVCS